MTMASHVVSSRRAPHPKTLFTCASNILQGATAAKNGRSE